MRIKELDKCFDRDTKATIEFTDTPAFDDGSMERIIAIYGDYHIHEISPVWDAVSQVAKLRITAATPARRGRPRKQR
ncbi:MAG: hypothetical protein Q4G33_14660 [bacterium]|nr:hypothetical protein [bacterium]